MEERQAQPHPGERVRAPTTKPGWEGKRPLFWRLPLLAFLVSGVVCLNYLDGRLSSDYRKSAADLAIQADAMIEGAVQNRAASINFFDLLQVRGQYQIKPPFPFTPGSEVAGVVENVGAEVSGISPGQRVMALPMLGGFSESSVASADRVFAMPDRMDFAEAAAMPIVYHTSYFALHFRGALRSGEWLLVHAGASGVGMSAIQIGKAAGARVIATASNQAKLDFCIEQGADYAIDYTGSGWGDEVRAVTQGHGADVIYDPVGGDVFDLSTKCIAPEGRLLVIGFASGRIPSIAANRILLKNISVVGAVWGQYVSNRPRYLKETQDALIALYDAGKISPVVSRRWPFDKAREALRSVADRSILGKAVLVV